MLHFIVPENQFDEQIVPDKKDGVFCDSSERFDIALAFSGKNIGFGSIKAGKNWIRSFGLHHHPLGQMENFGMDRESENLKDVRVVQGLNQYSITGWTKLVRGDIWTEVELQREGNAIDLYFRIENFGKEAELALALFISADTIHVGKQEIKPKTLSRYRGAAEPISCRTGQEVLQIIPSKSSGMQIIPLAGNQHFWGAGFLVAFDIPDLTTRFHVKML